MSDSAWSYLGLMLACLASLAGCSTAAPGGSAEPAGRFGTVTAAADFSVQKSTDLERLQLLYRQRTTGLLAADYPIGPGDIIDVTVPAMEELKAQSVRVGGDGMIALPFIGKLLASGLTEEQLRGEIAGRLLTFMHEPRVSVFVKEYKNRQVAVLGSVTKPGVYGLRSENDTILDLLAQAGGIVAGADPQIHLIPAELADKDAYRQFASALPVAAAGSGAPAMLLKKTEPIVIDLQELAYGGFQEYLSLSVRPGDVLMIPGGGQILVDGWVNKPGAYNVTPGLTVSGIVAAAGGLLYPADANGVKIIRNERGGKKTIIQSDLEKIRNGQEPDIRLLGGDLVEISATTDKLALYGIYRFFTTVVNVAVGANIPMFR